MVVSFKEISGSFQILESKLVASLFRGARQFVSVFDRLSVHLD